LKLAVATKYLYGYLGFCIKEQYEYY